MSILLLVIGIVLLIVLIAWADLNAFLAFILVSLFLGVVNGMDVTETVNSIQKGLGDLLGSLTIILGLGAMLGKLIATSGAAQKIASTLVESFGRRYLMWALVLTAFLIGIPLFYGVGFVLLVPLIITISYKYDIPAVYIGLPMLAALSVTHGYLPPHPSPTALVAQYKGDIGVTLFYGFIIAIPAIIIGGPLFATTLKKFTAKPLKAFASSPLPDDELPSLFNSIFTSFLPVILITLATITRLFIPVENIVTKTIISIGDPVIAMCIAVIYALYSLGIKRGKSMKSLMEVIAESVKDIAMILFIIGGAGALKQVLTDSGTNAEIAGNLLQLNIHPLLAAWTIAAIIRVALGSATVAGLTTAGIIGPMVLQSGIDPNLMVLATGAGSLMFSHVNDPGFWMFKEYFNLSIKDTMKTWSVMETIVSVVGLIGVFVIHSIIS